MEAAAVRAIARLAIEEHAGSGSQIDESGGTGSSNSAEPRGSTPEEAATPERGVSPPRISPPLSPPRYLNYHEASITFTLNCCKIPHCYDCNLDQVCSQTRLYSVDFSQSRIGVKKCVFRNAQSRFASVVVDGVLRPRRLARHT